MADRLYLRHSTDKQTNLRQKHHLASYLSDGAPAYEDAATSSRVHPLKRPGFRDLLDEAAVGDVVRVADAARLFRSVKDVLDVREVLRRRGLHLRVAAGAWAGMDLTSDDPMTKLFVTMLAGVLEFQRDMISENTKDGVAAARAEGKVLGRPAAFDDRQAADIVQAYQDGTAVKALARQHNVDPKTIRRVLDTAHARSLAAGELDSLVPVKDQEEAPDGRTVVIDVPGLLAERLRDTDVDEVHEALRDGQIIRRGQGYSVRVTAPLSTHSTVLGMSSALNARHPDQLTPAARKAHRLYADRVADAQDAP